MVSGRFRCLLAGVLVGNSAPHLATAATGRRHLTPVAGRDSGPSTNAVWGLANLIGGLDLLRRSASPETRWGRDLVLFESGVLAMAAWMAVTERLLGTNTG